MATTDELDKWFEWRERERRRHRVMTAAEYDRWCRDGDALSSPSDSNAFPGGLTIKLGKGPTIIGGFEDDP